VYTKFYIVLLRNHHFVLISFMITLNKSMTWSILCSAKSDVQNMIKNKRPYGLEWNENISMGVHTKVLYSVRFNPYTQKYFPLWMLKIILFINSVTFIYSNLCWIGPSFLSNTVLIHLSRRLMADFILSCVTRGHKFWLIVVVTPETENGFFVYINAWIYSRHGNVMDMNVKNFGRHPVESANRTLASSDTFKERVI
jgi:hypothetical protein